ncbi:MAG: D-glycero-alpha-D-manno-heptose-1,7-bisphosphate 7-phosphatase [Flavobacteriales bacterium]
MKVIFLDRDGVINMERGDYTWKLEDFKFVNGLWENLLLFQKHGFKFIVITNQGGIARGIYSHTDVDLVHSYMREQFKKHNINLLDVFYSPYHSIISKSLSRKPDSLMFEKAIALYNVNREQSVMIGDSERDIIAANKAGISGVLVNSNQNLSEIKSKIINE